MKEPCGFFHKIPSGQIVRNLLLLTILKTLFFSPTSPLSFTQVSFLTISHHQNKTRHSFPTNNSTWCGLTTAPQLLMITPNPLGSHCRRSPPSPHQREIGSSPRIQRREPSLPLVLRRPPGKPIPQRSDDAHTLASGLFEDPPVSPEDDQRHPTDDSC